MSKYLCIEDGPSTPVTSGKDTAVRIPLALIRAGVKLGLLVPSDTATRLKEMRQSVPQVNRLMTGDVGRLVWTGEALEIDTRDGRNKVSFYLE